MAMKFLIASVFILGLSQAQEILPGPCPDFVTKTDFEVKPYLGKWLEYAKIANTFEIGQKCNYAEYSDNGDGTVGVHNAGLSTSNGSFVEIYGYAVPTEVPGALKIHLEGVPFAGDYNVLDTDYVTYASVYSCTGFLGLGHADQAWILTRNATPSIEAEEAATGAFEKFGIDTSTFKKTVQDPCDFP